MIGKPRATVQPRCRWCGRLWLPPEGVDATRAYCARCRRERRSVAAQTFASENKEARRVGRYVFRVPKNASSSR